MTIWDVQGKNDPKNQLPRIPKTSYKVIWRLPDKLGVLICRLTASRLSLRPQELEKAMTPQELADLLAYLKGEL